MRPLFLFSAFCLVTAPVLAHDVAKGPNGGRLVDAAPHHIELVVKDRSIAVFITDGADKPVVATGFKGLAILSVSGKAQRVMLEPQETRLTGTSPVALPADVRGVVQITGPDGKTAQGRFQ